MNELFKYKGYFGSAEISKDDECLYGELLFIEDTITYESTTVKELEKEFQLAVDDYLEMCKIVGKEPRKPFAGSFNIRIGAELHKSLSVYAKARGISLNECIKEALRDYLTKQDTNVITHIHRVESAQTTFEQEKVIVREEEGGELWKVTHTSLN